MQPHLAAQYSFAGRRSKECFKNLPIFKVVCDAAKLSNINLTDREVEIGVQEVLKHAMDRIRQQAARRSHESPQA